MNDILLKPAAQVGCFDWTFNNSDIVNIIGDMQIKNAVLHAVFLKYNELEQAFYENKGNKAYNYINQIITTDDTKSNNQTQKIIETELKTVIEQINNVKTAEIKTEIKNNKILINKIKITKNDGGAFEIGI